MRFGFTTGSCAAAGAKAACYMLLSGREKRLIVIKTPKGIDFRAEILDIRRSESEVSCAVRKDGGDDPDITTGAHIVSTVRLLEKKGEEAGETSSGLYVVIKGGKGVGKVTKPGLDQKVGSAAINRVPREMIEKEVREVCSLFDYAGGVEVEISVPEGEALCGRTFNPRLGIVGGISILGTSGVVEPMSAQALKDTIFVELRQNRALGKSAVCVSPGNYGLDFMKETFDFDIGKSVKCSNFIGDTVDMARGLGFRKILLAGHIGKLIKISGGIMNTHSREGDCRMELLCAAALRAGCSLETARLVLDAVSTEEGISAIRKESLEKEAEERKTGGDLKTDGRHVGGNGSGKTLLESAMDLMMEKIMFFLERRAGENLEIACIVFCNEFGLLAKSRNALSVLDECRE